MEGLIVLVVEALKAILGPILAIIGIAFGLAASLLSLLAFLLYERLRRPKSASGVPHSLGSVVSPLETQAVSNPRGRISWTARVTLGASLLFLGSWILLELVFFQSIAQTIASRISKRTGLRISFQSARGSFLTGRLRLAGTHVQRGEGDNDSFDVHVDEMELHVRTLLLIRGELSLKRLQMKGLRGRYLRLTGAERRPRKPFLADELDLSDAEFDWTLRRSDRPVITVPLRVDRLRVAPFESANAAFGVLFRGEGAGTLAGSPWSIKSIGSGQDRRAHWSAERIPVSLLSDYWGEPIDWFKTGNVDLEVAELSPPGETGDVQLRSRFTFRNLRVAVPARIEGLKRPFGDALAKLANLHPRELHLEFTVILEQEGFMGRMSPDSLALPDAMAAGLVEELASRSGMAGETIRELGRASWARLKSWFGKRVPPPH